MDWIVKPLFLLAIGFGLSKYSTDNRSPLYPWHDLNSSAYIYIENVSKDTISIKVSAIEIDSAIRNLGMVLPDNTALIRLPYADTKVTVWLNNCIRIIKANKPEIYPVKMC